jgi:hypothetical protein
MFVRTTSSGHKIYTYTIKSGGTAHAVKKKFRAQIGASHASVDIVTEDGNIYAADKQLPAGTTVYVKAK